MNQLIKTLGPFKGAALMLNIVIGAGLLTLPGLAVESSGGLAFFSWLFCAAVAMPLLLVFVIMGRRYPDAGGIAHFAQLKFGRCAYIGASFLFLGAVVFGLPAIALAGGHYLETLIPIDPTLLAIGLLVVAASTQVASPDLASRLSAAIASFVMLALFSVIGVGFGGVEWSSSLIEMPSSTSADMEIILAPFMMIFFAFTGWEVAASLSEEFRNPRKDFPQAMVLSFIAATLLYLAMALIVQSYPINAGQYEAAFTIVMQTQLGDIGGTLMAVLAVIIVFANLMGAVWAVSRMVVSLSREKVLPLNLDTDAKGRPLTAVMLVTSALILVLCMDLAGLLSITTMLTLAGQNFLLLYALAAAALIGLSKVFFERAIALVALLISGVLIANQGSVFLYPACLIVAAFLVWWSQRTLLVKV